MNTRDTGRAEGPVTVASFDDLASAYIARSKLDHAGIPCFLSNEYVVGVNCLYSGLVQGVGVQVPAACAELAREILTEELAPEDIAPEEKNLAPDLETALFEPEQTCPQCGGSDVAHSSPQRRLLVLSYFLGGIPLRWRSVSCICRACGAKWRDRKL